MDTTLEVILSPAELTGLAGRDLRPAVCVVFDVLRATSTMITALAHGAQAIIPVGEIDEALALRRQHPECLLGGERDGVRIRADLTGGVEFDLGNSPREFTAERVRGRTVVMSTTNGTRALRACQGAGTVLVGSFLNLSATVKWIHQHSPANLLMVCSGTLELVSLEDALAAGALCQEIWGMYANGKIADSAQLARFLYEAAKDRLSDTVAGSRNGRRLSARPELRDDVSLCAQRDQIDLVAMLGSDGVIRAAGT